MALTARHTKTGTNAVSDFFALGADLWSLNSLTMCSELVNARVNWALFL
jgi:hypothetical protein